MNVTNLALILRGFTGRRRVALVAILLVLAAALTYVFGRFSPTDTDPASWWPAAGVIVVLAVVVPKRRRVLVLVVVVVVTAPALYLVGRSVAGAIIGALAVAIEAWIVARAVTDHDDQPRLTTLHDVIRFLVGVLAGSAFIGLVTGLSVGLITGHDFFIPAVGRMASHASAIVLIVPVMLVTQVVVPKGEPLKRVVHAILIVGAVFLSFAPGQFASLAFLPVPFLVWSAFSFTMAFTLFELVGVSIIGFVLTQMGGGPFSEAQGAALSPSLLLQLYVVTLSITALLVAAARNERQQLGEQMAATARLLYAGFELSQNGFAIVQADQGNYTLMEANNASALLLPASLVRRPTGRVEVVPGSGLHELLDRMVAEGIGEVTVSGDDELPVTVTITMVENTSFGQILLVSIIDLRPLRAAEAAAQRQVEGERAVVEELRALNQQKDDFVSSVTHELRTPITTVMGFAEELESTGLDDEQRDYVAIIQRNAERLLSVVEDVLTFSRRMPGTTGPIVLGSVDVSDVIVSVLDDLRHSIRDKNITTETRMPDTPVPVIAQSDYLARVIINLLTNAVKFTPRDGTIVIAVTVSGGRAEITITDSGPGIAQQDLDKVFDRFYRSSRASHDGVPGTGLGLSIVRELVSEMAGTVALESDGVHGTVARLVLPIAAAGVLREQ